VAASGSGDRLVTLGRVGAPHGVHGWIRITSSTRPPAAILDFAVWWLGEAGHERAYTVEDARVQGERVIARLAGVDGRDQVAVGAGPLEVHRGQQIPEIAPGV